MGRRAGNRKRRGRLVDYIRRRILLWVARRKGAESGRLERPPSQPGNGEKKSTTVPESLMALVKIVYAPLWRYLRDAGPRRAAAWKLIESAPGKIRAIAALERLLQQPVYPARLPVLKSRFFLASDFLFVAVVEAVFTAPVLGVVRDLAGGAQWFLWLVALMIGGLLAMLVVITGRALAYVLHNPDLRDVVQYRSFWLWTRRLAFLGVVCILILPVFLAVFREQAAETLTDAERKIDKILETRGLPGVPVSNAPTADPQPAPDDSAKTPEPNLWWIFWAQEGALLAGITLSILWFTGEPYRRYEKEVVGGYKGIAREVSGAREELDTLAQEDEAMLTGKLNDADQVLHEFAGARAAAAANARKPPLEKLLPLDHSEVIATFHAIARARLADLDGQVEAIQRQIGERLSPAPERRAIE